jgi:hypothetical protein
LEDVSGATNQNSLSIWETRNDDWNIAKRRKNNFFIQSGISEKFVKINK